MKITAFTIGIVIVLAALGWFWFLNACEDDWCFIFDWQKARRVTDFDSCVRLGFGVMESYPPQCSAGGKTYRQDIGNELEKRDLIRIARPRPNGTIRSPLIIEGEARGGWFFEASFPMYLLDANGNRLGSGHAEAKGEWMTTEFVPFLAVLEFTKPAMERGTLVLQKDNPSGLPEHDDELRIPVQFAAP